MIKSKKIFSHLLIHRIEIFFVFTTRKIGVQIEPNPNPYSFIINFVKSRMDISKNGPVNPFFYRSSNIKNPINQNFLEHTYPNKLNKH